MLGSDRENSRRRWGKSTVATRKWNRQLWMEGSLVFSDLVTETTKKSLELVAEASKKADQIKSAALDQIQIQQIKSLSLSDIIPAHLSSLANSSPSSSSSSSSSASASYSESELRTFGVTDDLRDFVKGLTSTTFQSFPIQEEAEASDVTTTVSNVRKDLTEWQEKHATIVLTTVKVEWNGIQNHANCLSGWVGPDFEFPW
ncbi:hypothetical protein CMV_022268 [Castanea mollissima]|uniref:Uncharacterized protein n=1 Tax=Castanea mollissima TaxID=60419 RepID=A0A8J4QRV7_9ROSI|nr:hypothetical protein CMV_022268 [Castanea mollissima]